MSPILNIRDLLLFYENAVAVNNVSLQVNEGQIAGVFGSNSAGKSSLMLCISGIILDVKKKEKMRGGERITLTGEIRFRDEDVMEMEPSDRARKGIILCPERRLIFPESSSIENLKMGALRIKRNTDFDERLQAVFRIFPILEDRLDQYTGTLSGGEQAMVAIGRGLMGKPKILLLDEPSLGLAPILVEKFFDAIKRINEEGMTVFLIEQNARKTLSISVRGYVLQKGEIIVQGSKTELLETDVIKRAYLQT